jgi:hypothetical protein
MVDVVGWPLSAFDWLLATSQNSLTSLTLIDFDALFSLDELFTFLTSPSHGASDSLRRLTVRNYLDTSPSTSPSFDDFSPLSPRAFDPNTLSTYFPSLTHLILAQNDNENCFSTPRPFLRLPPRLVELELYEDLFLEWRLLAAVEEGEGPALRRVRTVGPFASDPDVRELGRACERRGIECEVERSF